MDSLGTVLMEAKLRNFLRNYSSCLPRNVTFIGMMGKSDNPARQVILRGAFVLEQRNDVVISPLLATVSPLEAIAD